MTISTEPIARGANAHAFFTASAITKTRKKVHKNSTVYFFIGYVKKIKLV
jgi:hypothetical protein